MGKSCILIAAVTNEAGAVIERLAYDPWGKRRYPNGTADTSDALLGLTTDRGYTEHEHIDEMGLINMNGRIYDPQTKPPGWTTPPALAPENPPASVPPVDKTDPNPAAPTQASNQNSTTTDPTTTDRVEVAQLTRVIPAVIGLIVSTEIARETIEAAKTISEKIQEERDHFVKMFEGYYNKGKDAVANVLGVKQESAEDGPKKDEAGRPAATPTEPSPDSASTADKAKELGYDRKVKDPPFNSHGQPVFTNGKDFIKPDVDQHNGGEWKGFDRRGVRTGTYDGNLDRIGK